MPQPDTITNGALEALFAQARATAPAPSPDLMGRVLAQAYDNLPEAPPPARRARSTRDRSIGRLLQALRSWGPMGGLAAAGIAGLVIGYTAPAPLDHLSPFASPDDSGYELADLMVSLETYYLEEN